MNLPPTPWVLSPSVIIVPAVVIGIFVLRVIIVFSRCKTNYHLHSLWSFESSRCHGLDSCTECFFSWWFQYIPMIVVLLVLQILGFDFSICNRPCILFVIVPVVTSIVVITNSVRTSRLSITPSS